MRKTQYDDEPYLPHDNSASPQDLDCTQEYGDDDSHANKKTGKWTSDEDKLLRKYVPMYGEKQWRKISEHIPGRSSIQCLHRWTKILKPGLVKGPWTAEEDQRLIMWVKTEGPTKWAQAANFITGRSGKQCRERWFNNLNPDVKKGNWSKEEDELIYDMYQKYGTSWSKIAKFISGRTENAIKNRFYSTLRKLAADQRKSNDVQNTVVGTSQKSESADEAYDPVTQNVASPGEQYGGEAPNTLYKLLQEKVQPPEGETPLKLETVKTGKETVYEPEEGPTQQNTISNQKSNETGKELFMTKKTQQQEQTQTMELLSKVLKPMNPVKRPILTDIEFENEGWTFEKFLLSLDGDSNPSEAVLRENETKETNEEDIGRFDKLQQKILNYCQDNIHSLAEAFKSMANNNNSDTSPSIPSGSKARARTVTQILPAQPRGFKIEASPAGSFYQENIKGIKISAPMPVTRINYSNQSNPAISPFTSAVKENPNAYGGNLAAVMKHEDDYTQGYAMIPPVMMSNKSSPVRGFESPQINNLDLYEHRMNSQNDIYLATTPVKNKVPAVHRRDVPGGVEWDYTMIAQQNRFNNMIETPQNIANITSITNMQSMQSMVNMAAAPREAVREGEESDKKINFLFQQLYSLEGLLANARNELLKLEGTLNDADPNKENIYKLLGKEKPVREYNEMFGSPVEDLDQVVKKRKQM